jgi:hypothetical protein
MVVFSLSNPLIETIYWRLAHCQPFSLTANYHNVVKIRTDSVFSMNESIKAEAGWKCSAGTLTVDGIAGLNRDSER